MIGAIAIVMTALGAILILTGVWISLRDRKGNLAAEGTKAEELAGVDFEGLAKLVDALRQSPVGVQLIVWGIVLLFAAAIVGAGGSLAA